MTGLRRVERVVIASIDLSYEAHDDLPELHDQTQSFPQQLVSLAALRVDLERSRFLFDIGRLLREHEQPSNSFLICHGSIIAWRGPPVESAARPQIESRPDR